MNSVENNHLTSSFFFTHCLSTVHPAENNLTKAVNLIIILTFFVSSPGPRGPVWLPYRAGTKKRSAAIDH